MKEATWLRLAGAALIVLSVGWLFGAWPTPEEEADLRRFGQVGGVAVEQAKQTVTVVSIGGFALGLILIGLGGVQHRQDRLTATDALDGDEVT
ncbi:hypothetical protein [Caenispirillum bisanense]|uniref:Uncharacterized protein n=1 Tax=Caenispirillum bisanense TaxID=414052 RepID=A0A286GYZ1_9PROT|nr:hypothetical protein [Caenispirillum bisanense]SOE00701.1 hypothetical protein SAMN05421508_113107 [Caenispirillum bisanense]